MKNLLTILLESDKYGERRGAAYGLAGFVKGLGILSLKQLDIITVLTEAIQNKKNLKHREGRYSEYLLTRVTEKVYLFVVISLLYYLYLNNIIYVIIVYTVDSLMAHKLVFMRW